MDKFSVASQIRTAKRAHVSWLMNADALMQGIPMEKEQIPVNDHDCVFGKWLYSEGQTLTSLESFNELEQAHQNLHDVYAHIFSILYEENDQSFFSKLIGSKSTVSAKNMELVRDLFKGLKSYSDEMIRLLDLLEHEAVDYFKDGPAH